MAKYRVILSNGENQVEERSGFLYSVDGDARWEQLHINWECLLKCCKSAGATVIPIIEENRPTLFEFRGRRYFLTWNDNRLIRIVRHQNDDVEEISWNEFPAELKGLL